MIPSRVRRYILQTHHAEPDRERTWDEDSTVANHQSLTLRALFDHEAQGRDTKWTLAAYETPVSERLWHATAAASTPAELCSPCSTPLRASQHGAQPPALRRPPSRRRRARSPTRAGSRPSRVATSTGKPPAKVPQASSSTPSPQDSASAAPCRHGRCGAATPSNQPTWALELSSHFPTPLLQDIAFELAEGQGVRTIRPAPPQGQALRTIQAGVAPALVAPRLARQAGNSPLAR
ncbi:DUF317 domain-containing protein [Streptomyces inhibens]|uniref:DUF317 domain-containing protein n=1 Tax=Streptomyces inhibens TaxID=2293571 RepID=UPI0037B2801F